MNTAKELIALVEEERFRLRDKGMGGFLNPPGHPEHDFSVASKSSLMSLSSAIKSSYVNDAIKKQAQDLLNRWEREKLSLSDPKIQDWIHQVMGYFEGMYNLGSGWGVDKLSHQPGIDPIENQDKHAGVHFIRNFYPNFKLTQDQVDGAYWGDKK